MILWRLTDRRYADLSGEGARRHGGRWNSPGCAVVYLAEHPALAVLEVLVHLDLPYDLIPDSYVMMRVDAPDDHYPTADAAPDARAYGDEWLAAGASPLLRVASVIAPHSFNWLLNPEHTGAARVAVTEAPPFQFDERLFAT
ncbi:MAG: RES family NAD+ phosphorylase [Pseudomonadota bacterium]